MADCIFLTLGGSAVALRGWFSNDGMDWMGQEQVWNKSSCTCWWLSGCSGCWCTVAGCRADRHQWRSSLRAPDGPHSWGFWGTFSNKKWRKRWLYICSSEPFQIWLKKSKYKYTKLCFWSVGDSLATLAGTLSRGKSDSGNNCISSLR